MMEKVSATVDVSVLDRIYVICVAYVTQECTFRRTHTVYMIQMAAFDMGVSTITNWERGMPALSYVIMHV